MRTFTEPSLKVTRSCVVTGYARPRGQSPATTPI